MKESVGETLVQKYNLKRGEIKMIAIKRELQQQQQEQQQQQQQQQQDKF